MPVIEWLDSLKREDLEDFGIKTWGIYEVLKSKLTTPPGFVISPSFFEEYIEKLPRINSILNELIGGPLSYDRLKSASSAISSLILNENIASKISDEIKKSYDRISLSNAVRNASSNAIELVGGQRESPAVVIRASLPNDGISKSQINISGGSQVVEHVKRVLASVYSPESLGYLLQNKDGLIQKCAIIVQKMIDTEKSGVVHTLNPVTGSMSEVVVEAIWGMGNALSDGLISPDYYLINKESGNLEEKNISLKTWCYMRHQLSGSIVREKIPSQKVDSRVLNTEELRELVNTVLKLENELGSPISVSFGYLRGHLYIFGVRKLKKGRCEIREFTGRSLAEGRSISPGISSGTVKIINDSSELASAHKSIVCFPTASPELIAGLGSIKGIITQCGGVSSKLCRITRNFGIPVIVVPNMDDIIQDQEVTLDGISGKVYKVKEVLKKDDSGDAIITATSVMTLSEDVGSAEGIIVPEGEFYNETRVMEILKTNPIHEIWFYNKSLSLNPYSGPGTDIMGRAGNIGIIYNINESVNANFKKGLIIKDFPTLMQLNENIGLDFIVLDVEAMKEYVKLSETQMGEHPAIVNSIKRIVHIARASGAEKGIILRYADRKLIEEAINAGVSAIVTTPENFGVVKRLVAKSEKRFLLDSFRKMRQ